jgi:tetratricopeptide (TPR) repeat protein
VLQRVLVALLLVVLAPAARADDRGAKAAYREGVRRYDRGDYFEALAAFERAFRISDAPGLLFNIAQCQRKLGRRAVALQFYRSYLTRVPDATDRPAIEATIRELEAPPPPLDRTPLYKKWWLWTIVGVAVAGGVALGVGLGVASQRSHFESTIPDLGPSAALRVRF